MEIAVKTEETKVRKGSPSFKKIPIGDVDKLEEDSSRMDIVPPKEAKELSGRMKGVVVEHIHKTGDFIGTKIVTKFENGYRAVFCYKPSKVLDLGTEVEFTLGQDYRGRDSATDLSVVNQTTEISELIMYAMDTDVMEDAHIAEIYLSSLAQAYLETNHVGTGLVRIQNFLKSMGIVSIIGRIGNKLIYRQAK